MTSEGTILHVILHMTTILVALVLFILSAISYSRDKRVKFLYISGAFLMFFIRELILALEVFIYSNTDPVIVHPLSLIILMLFFAGVTK